MHQAESLDFDLGRTICLGPENLYNYKVGEIGDETLVCPDIEELEENRQVTPDIKFRAVRL